MEDGQFLERQFDGEAALEVFTSKYADIFKIFFEYIYNKGKVEMIELKELRKNTPCRFHLNEIIEKLLETGLIFKRSCFDSAAPQANFNQKIYCGATEDGKQFFKEILLDA